MIDMYLRVIMVIIIEKAFTVLKHLVYFVGRSLISRTCAAWDSAKCSLLSKIFIVVKGFVIFV